MSGPNVDPLSYSSSTLLLNCEMKYYLKKVAKVEPDSDAPIDTLAMDVGSVLHRCLELCRHDLPGFKVKTLLDVCEEYGIPDDGHQRPMLWGMLRKYKDLHEKVGLRARAVEMELVDPDFVGYVDVILENPESGEWWITDLKTAASVSKFLRSRLHKDRQLNIYAEKIARMADYDLKGFRGCRYRVVTKTKIKAREGESFSKTSDRMYKSVRAYDFAIPLEALDPKTEGKHFDSLRKRQVSLWKGTRKPVRNLTYCEAYYRPCEYWSQCHGSEFSAEPKVVEVSV
jgi:hypothetical protein